MFAFSQQLGQIKLTLTSRAMKLTSFVIFFASIAALEAASTCANGKNPPGCCENGSSSPYCCENGSTSPFCCANNSPSPSCCENGSASPTCCENGSSSKYCCLNNSPSPYCCDNGSFSPDCHPSGIGGVDPGTAGPGKQFETDEAIDVRFDENKRI